MFKIRCGTDNTGESWPILVRTLSRCNRMCRCIWYLHHSAWSRSSLSCWWCALLSLIWGSQLLRVESKIRNNYNWINDHNKCHEFYLITKQDLGNSLVVFGSQLFQFGIVHQNGITRLGPWSIRWSERTVPSNKHVTFLAELNQFGLIEVRMTLDLSMKDH